jgi:acyl-coenzyme A synthetase/AMP-(fatty) acid ligase
MGSFVEWSRRSSEMPALAGADSRLTYGELYDMAQGAAMRLDQLGIGCGERVAVWESKSPETVALVLACLMTGRPVLLPPIDLRLDVLHELLEYAGTDRLLTTRPLEGAMVVKSAIGAAGDGPWVVDNVSADDVALILTTSGSTGFPKVVPISYGAIRRFADWASTRFEIAPGTAVLSYCGLSFDLSILEVWTTLMHGGCAVLVAQERATHGDHLLDLVLAHEVNVLQGIPMLYGLLTAAAASREGCVAGSVRHSILTGDVAPASSLEGLPRLLERARLYNVYGCTETNDSFLCEFDVERSLELGAIPLGWPLPGVSALIVDEAGVVNGVGGGELWVSTPFQAQGYLGSRSCGGDFVPDPRGCSQRTYFRSGDLVRRDATGMTFLEGRRDRQVKVRGMRLNLQAVEQAILEIPGIGEAAVVAFDEPLAGKRLHAVVRGRHGAAVDTLHLRQQCARRLTRVAIPSIIEVQDEPLPRTTNGKIDREALRRLCERGHRGHDR